MSSSHYCPLWLSGQCDGNDQYAEYNHENGSWAASQYCIDMLSVTITACVQATNQTYVESLKGKDLFDEEAQREAFQQTFNAVMGILSDEARAYLSEAYGDLDELITAKIEAEVSAQKEESLF